VTVEHVPRYMDIFVGDLLPPGISRRPAERPDELARGRHKWISMWKS